MDLNIRRALPEDAETVYTMICKLEDTVLEKDYFMECYRHNVNGSVIFYLLAFDGEDALGFLSCHGQYLLHHTGTVYEIQEMFVEEGHRSKRIGQALLTHLETLLKETDCCSLEVTSNTTRTLAHRFYLRNGFRQSHLKFTKQVN